MTKLKSKLKLVKGFTLIEMLVVIAIIGILASIVYAPFQTARRKGRDAQKVIEMKNLLTSINLYADGNNGNFPTSLVALDQYQVDPLPPKANLTAEYDPQDYNYQPFYSSNTANTGAVVGFHLWTHLETNNGALAGASKCDGINRNGTLVGNTAGNSNLALACISLNAGSAGSNALGVQDPANITGSYTAYTPKFASSSRIITGGTGEEPSDTDQNCATDLSACILDYHQ